MSLLSNITLMQALLQFKLKDSNKYQKLIPFFPINNSKVNMIKPEFSSIQSNLMNMPTQQDKDITGLSIKRAKRDMNIKINKDISLTVTIEVQTTINRDHGMQKIIDNHFMNLMAELTKKEKNAMSSKIKNNIKKMVEIHSYISFWV